MKYVKRVAREGWHVCIHHQLKLKVDIEVVNICSSFQNQCPVTSTMLDHSLPNFHRICASLKNITTNFFPQNLTKIECFIFGNCNCFQDLKACACFIMKLYCCQTVRICSALQKVSLAFFMKFWQKLVPR